MPSPLENVLNSVKETTDVGVLKAFYERAMEEYAGDNAAVFAIQEAVLAQKERLEAPAPAVAPRPAGSMALTDLSPAAREVCEWLAHGHSVKHGVHGVTKGAPVPLGGEIAMAGASFVEVSEAVMKELEAAGVPLHTYEHNINEGWKTIIPPGVRGAVANELLSLPRVVGQQPGEAFERFLDDGQFFVEWNNNFARDSGNGFLMVRCEPGLTAPAGVTVAGGYEQGTNGKWSADLLAPYDDEKDSDCRVLGEFETRNEAIAALWKERESAYIGVHRMTADPKLAIAWRDAMQVAEEKGSVVFGSLSEGREFDGKVLHADAVYVVQNLGRGVAVHRTEALSREVKVGEVLSVKYNAMGRGVIPERQVSLERE